MIASIREINFPKYATIDHATCKLFDMGEKTIVTQMNIDSSIIPDFSYDWEVEFMREKYIMPLRKPQGAEEDTNIDTTRSLTFQHWAVYQLKRYYFFTVQAVGTGIMVYKYIAPVSLDLGALCKLFGKVLNYYYGVSIKIDLNPAWQYSKDPVKIDINYSSIWTVLTKFYEMFAVRWQIEPVGDINHYVIKVGYPTSEISHIFEFGFDGGLLRVEHQVQDENIRNILLGRGGSKNLPYRYFKDVDPNNPSFPADPDWIPELRDVPFTELMPKTFRDYVKGWKTNPKRQLVEKNGTPITPYPHDDTVKAIKVEPFDSSYAVRSWAYLKGHQDAEFDPVDYVMADGYQLGDGKYYPEKDSISKYGPLWGGLENNENIYPTIQNVNPVDDPDIGRVDETVAIEEIKSDDVLDAAESNVRISNVPKCEVVALNISPNEYKKVSKRCTGTFTVLKGEKANLEVTPKIIRVMESDELLDASASAELYDTQINVYKADGTGKRSASGITEGVWIYEIVAEVHNLTNDKTINVTVSDESPRLTAAVIGDQKKWTNTFDIWIKNIWESEKHDKETDEQYVERVWRPILGDHEGNEAKVVFTDGMLSTSEDYVFTIIKGGVHYDATKNRGGVRSEWRLTLAKSDADLESLGLYVPSTKRQGKAGDHFAFIGIDLPHQYILWAEANVDKYKTDQLDKVNDIKSTFVVALDKVRIGNEGNAGALIDQLHIGDTFTLFDRQFISGSAQEKLKIQSITYTYNKPTDQDPGLVPDVEIVVSGDFAASTTTSMEMLKGDVSALQRQFGSISSLESIVRAVGDRIYLRKDGVPDRSLSPTEYASLLTSLGFRNGIVGGTGWGFFQDENGNWVLETDNINVRQKMQVNTLVINQIEARGGLIIESCAAMEVTEVVKDGNDYRCFFDQHGGTVLNLFQTGDIGYCNRYISESGDVKFYKRRVVAVYEDSIVLSSSDHNGDGIPASGDVIVQYGNYNRAERQYVIIRDVLGGGYERYLEGLNSVNSNGTEYLFMGRQIGMYGGRPRFFIGDKESWLKYENGKLSYLGDIDIKSTYGGNSFGSYIENNSLYLLDLSDEIIPIPCYPDGTNLPGVLPVYSKATVFHGTRVDSGWTFTAEYIGCTGTCNSISGDISIDAVSAGNVASVRIKAVKHEAPELEAAIQLPKTRNGESSVIYTLEPSVSSITRDANGQLSAPTVIATKYKTVGSSGRRPTQEKKLFYKQEGVDSTFIAGNTGSSFVSVDVNKASSAVIFELRDDDGITILDRERVPVLTDASGLDIGGANLLRNTDFLDDGEHWDLYTGGADAVVDYNVPKDNIYGIYKGRKAARFTVNGVTGNTFSMVSQPTTDVKGDTVYTFSGYVLIPDLSTIDGWGQVIIRYYNSGGTETLVVASKEIFKAGEWRYVTKTFTTPLEVTQMRIAIQFQRNGDVFFNSFKIEEGNIPTGWSAAAEDASYLRLALRNSTSIDGGLILATLLKLGYMLKNGERVIMSGMNGGIVNNMRDTAFWAGGEEPVATYKVRHDGSVSACRGTVRFEENRVEVGDSVRLDDAGLKLVVRDGHASLVVENSSVGNTLALQQNWRQFDRKEWSSPGFLWVIRNSETLGLGEYFVKVLEEFYEGIGKVQAGSTISMAGFVSFSLPEVDTIHKFHNQFVITLQMLQDDKYVDIIESKVGFSIIGNSVSARTSLSVIAKVEGTYRLKLSMPVLNEVGGVYVGKGVDVAWAASGRLTYGIAEQNKLGNDGFISTWGNAVLLCRSDMVGMMAGNHGIRLTAAGIEYTNDGNNWKLAKFQ